jgi:hypothetical protein
MPTSIFSNLAQDATLQSLVTLLSTPATDLPHEPTDDTSDLTYLQLTRTTSGATDIVAATGGQSTRLHDYEFTCSGPCTVEIINGASVSLRKHVMPAAGGYSSGFRTRPWAVTAINQKLQFKTTGAVQVDGQFYTQTSVPA